MPAIAERHVLAEGPKIITTKEQHAAYVSWLRELQRQKHLRGNDLDTARTLILVIKDYEAKRFPPATASSRDVLQELMEANNLRQRDLAPILGGESVVSLVLSGQRKLNRHQIEKLSKRFHLSPAVFF